MDRLWVVILLLLASCIPGFWLFGMKYIGALIIAVLTGIIVYFFTLLFLDIGRYLKKQWNLYKKEREQEAEEIMRRLRG